jgi:hypothetical protein
MLLAPGQTVNDVALATRHIDFVLGGDAAT